MDGLESASEYNRVIQRPVNTDTIGSEDDTITERLFVLLYNRTTTLQSQWCQKITVHPEGNIRARKLAYDNE